MIWQTLFKNLHKVLFLVFILFSCTPRENKSENEDPVLALVGATIYSSPDTLPITHGVVLIQNDKIIDVSEQGKIDIPENATQIDCTGKVLTAGFWNSHVHFIEPKWQHSDSLPAAQLNAQFEEMFTQYGFTHVFELATFDLNNTLALEKRIESGEVNGPEIYTTGVPFTPPNGSPYYIAPLKLPELGTPEEATAYVYQQISQGADAIKIWSASPAGGKIINMPIPVGKAGVEEAHRLEKKVFAHPSNIEGVEIAIKCGVDILTHVAPDDRISFSKETLDRMTMHEMVLIPTLKLYKWDLEKNGIDPENPLTHTAMAQLGDYAKAGGTILFGTDVGYMTDYSPTDEYEMMARAGLSPAQILASLTYIPAQLFNSNTGTIAKGMDADIVVLANDPMNDPKAFSEVDYTIRKGKVIFQRSKK